MTFKYAVIAWKLCTPGRFEVLAAVWLRMQVFWDVTTCLWISGWTVEFLKLKAP